MDDPTTPLSSSLALPLVGLGTWELKGKECTRVVKEALSLGYRHFDTACLYHNHAALRAGLQGFDRHKLILTSKFALTQLTSTSLERLLDQVLLELGTDYLDLFLMHYPIRSYPMEKVIEEMGRLVEKQKLRAIGVSNCTTRHLADLLKMGPPIAVNQVEFHPFLYQKTLLHFCHHHQIEVVGYRSLGKGKLLAEPLFQKIGDKYHKTAAQICLKWLVDKKIPVIPKASSCAHLKENLALFDFTLEKADSALLDSLPHHHRYCYARDWSDFSYD